MVLAFRTSTQRLHRRSPMVPPQARQRRRDPRQCRCGGGPAMSTASASGTERHALKRVAAEAGGGPGGWHDRRPGYWLDGSPRGRSARSAPQTRPAFRRHRGPSGRRRRHPGLRSRRLRERRDWAILQHPIDVQVDVLVVEAEQVFDLWALGNWRRITPHDVLDELVAHPSRPVARHSLIRTARDILGGLEQIHTYIQLWDVITGRQSSLEEEHRSASVTHGNSADLHAHVPRAVDGVDPCVRVSRVNEYLLILLEPRVHLIPVKGEMAVQCRSMISRTDVSAGSVLSDAILYHQAPANGVRRLL